jgi:hypothetical protein
VIAGTATSVSRRVARRHDQKAARLEAKAAKAPSSTRATASSGEDLVDRLQRLADLKASGALNAQEYSAAKAKLLSH